MIKLTQVEYKKLEQLLDKVATAVVTNLHHFTTDQTPADLLLQNQKTIRDGILTTGLIEEGEKKVFYQKELEANTDDVINPDQAQDSLLNVLYDAIGGSGDLADLDMSIINVGVSLDNSENPMVMVSGGQIAESRNINSARFLPNYRKPGTSRSVQAFRRLGNSDR